MIDGLQIKGQWVVRVHEAKQARQLVVTFCAAAHKPAAARSSYEAATLRDFEVLEGDAKRATARTLFESAYSSRFASRSANFAKEIERADVTTHQLRRFLRIHETTAKAKEHYSDLKSFDEQTAELLHDEQRVVAACDRLRFGAERLCDICFGEDGHPADEHAVELAIPGGRGTHGALLEMLTIAAQSNTPKALQMLKDRRREWVAQRGHAASLRGPLHDEGNPMVETVGALDRSMARTYAVNSAAEAVQRKWRGFVGRSLLDTAHHLTAVARITKDYMYEQTTDHVRKVWEDDRRVEREEYERSYKQLLAKDNNLTTEEQSELKAQKRSIKQLRKSIAALESAPAQQKRKLA